MRLAPSFTNPSMCRCVHGLDVLLAAPLPPGRPRGADRGRPDRDAGRGRRRRHRPGHALADARRAGRRSARSRRAWRRRTRPRPRRPSISTAGDALADGGRPEPGDRASSSTARSRWRARCGRARRARSASPRRRRRGAADAAARPTARRCPTTPSTLAFQQAIGANEPLRTGQLREDADVHAVDDHAVATPAANLKVAMAPLGSRAGLSCARPGPARTRSAGSPSRCRSTCRAAPPRG